jgi:DNA polymerase elongation subunit (family B)
MNEFGILDFETDPFRAGRIPFPFAAGIYFGPQQYRELWEPNIIEKTIRYLTHLNACVLWAHNGGKFDFHYLVEYAKRDNIKIQNGRIVEMQIGKVILKDSWPLIPFALDQYKKTKINYDIFEESRRNKPANRQRIAAYLFDDCKNLHDLLTGFRAVVGPKDTIGSASFYQMKLLGMKIHRCTETHDATFRPYFFGGRVEAFQKGIFKGPLKYLDINSAYPFAMRENHPHGPEYFSGQTLPPKKLLGPSFIRCIAESRGALPLRGKTGLEFPHATGEFYATGWEIAAGLKTRTLKILEILETWIPRSYINFSEYVDTFFALRQKAKKDGDEIKRLAYKYLMNSGYGKFAQNPRDFKEYKLAKFGNNVPGFDWETDFGAVSLWSRPKYDPFGFYDVATGASITGFVRAMLWKAICASTGVLYGDTDSLICRNSRVKMGEELGEWKLEGKLKRAAIAGKKLYGVEWDQTHLNGERWKIASKGARLEWREILDLCNGEAIEWENDAPTFSVKGTHFVTRTIRAT